MSSATVDRDATSDAACDAGFGALVRRTGVERRAVDFDAPPAERDAAEPPSWAAAEAFLAALAFATRSFAAAELVVDLRSDAVGVDAGASLASDPDPVAPLPAADGPTGV